MENIQDLYRDYLLSSFGQATSKGLSSVLHGAVSHDKISGHLSGGASGGKELGLSVKPFAKKYPSKGACLIFDDTIIEKPYSKTSEHNYWHRDYVRSRNVKDINLLCCFYHSQCEEGTVRCPINYMLVVKPVLYGEVSTRNIGILQTGKAKTSARHGPFRHESEGISGRGLGRLQRT